MGGGKIEYLFFYGHVYDVNKRINFDDVKLYLVTAEGRWGFNGGKGLAVVHKDIIGLSYTSVEADTTQKVYETHNPNSMSTSYLSVSFHSEHNLTFLMESPTLEQIENSDGPLYNVSEIKPIPFSRDSELNPYVSTISFLQAKILS